MFTLTFDTNCIYAIENKEENFKPLKFLVQQHEQKRCHASLVAISASERQKGGRYLTNYADFQERIEKLDLGQLGQILPVGYWDITFWDRFVGSTDEIEEMERRLHQIIFPKHEFSWSETCEKYKIDLHDKQSKYYRNWLNRKCDILALLAHWLNNRDCFVTSDKHFLSKAGNLKKLGIGFVQAPLKNAQYFGYRTE